MSEEAKRELLEAVRAGGGESIALTAMATVFGSDERLVRMLQPNREEMSFECVIATENVVYGNSFGVPTKLDCDIESWDMTPVAGGTVPLLRNHDHSGEPLGRVERIWGSKMGDAASPRQAEMMGAENREVKCICAKIVCNQSWGGRSAFTAVEQGVYKAVSLAMFFPKDMSDFTIKREGGAYVISRGKRGLPLSEVTLTGVPADRGCRIANEESEQKWREKYREAQNCADNIVMSCTQACELSEENKNWGESFCQSRAFGVLAQSLSKEEQATMKTMYNKLALLQSAASATGSSGDGGGGGKDKENAEKLQALSLPAVMQSLEQARKDGKTDAAAEFEAELKRRDEAGAQTAANLTQAQKERDELKAALEAREAEDKRVEGVNAVLQGERGVMLQQKAPEEFKKIEAAALKPGDKENPAMLAQSVREKITDFLLDLSVKEGKEDGDKIKQGANKTLPDLKFLAQDFMPERLLANEPSNWSEFSSPLILCSQEESGDGLTPGALSAYLQAQVTGEGVEDLRAIFNARDFGAKRSFKMLQEAYSETPKMQGLGERRPSRSFDANGCMEIGPEIFSARMTPKFQQEMEAVWNLFADANYMEGSFSLRQAASTTKSDIEAISMRTVTNLVEYLWSKLAFGRMGAIVHPAFAEVIIPVVNKVPVTSQHADSEDEGNNETVVTFSDYGLTKHEIKPTLVATAVSRTDFLSFFMRNSDAHIVASMMASHNLGCEQILYEATGGSGLITGLLNTTGIGVTTLQGDPAAAAGQLPKLTNELTATLLNKVFGEASQRNARKRGMDAFLAPHRVRNAANNIYATLTTKGEGNITHSESRPIWDRNDMVLDVAGLESNNFSTRDITYKGAAAGATTNEKGTAGDGTGDRAATANNETVTVGDALYVGDGRSVHIGIWQYLRVDYRRIGRALKEEIVMTDFRGLTPVQTGHLRKIKGIPLDEF